MARSKVLRSTVNPYVGRHFLHFMCEHWHGPRRILVEVASQSRPCNMLKRQNFPFLGDAWQDTVFVQNPCGSIDNLVNRRCAGVYFRKAIFYHFMKVWQSEWSCCLQNKTYFLSFSIKGALLKSPHCQDQGIFFLNTKCWPSACGFPDFYKLFIRFLKIIPISYQEIRYFSCLLKEN